MSVTSEVSTVIAPIAVPLYHAPRGCSVAEEGADLLDIGGMSSRPGSEEISETEELNRVLSVLNKLDKSYPLPISIDTYRDSVGRVAVERGAVIVNDITGLRGDSRLAATVAESGAGLVLVHMRGTPRTMQSDTHYHNLISEIRGFFCECLKVALAAGIEADKIVLDPGIGFGKSIEGNLELIRNLSRFKNSNSHSPGLDTAGLLLGPSRKSFIGNLLGRPAGERIWGTAAAVALAISGGADVVRVHDVSAMVDVCRMADTIVRGG